MKTLTKNQTCENCGSPLWMLVLVITSVIFTCTDACALPFAACGVVAALTLSRKDALLAIALMWVANQIIGFSYLNYPLTAQCFAWGAVIGLTAIVSTLAAQFSLKFTSGIKQIVAAFVVAFAAYEMMLFATSFVLGGLENYTLVVQGQILAINALSLPALLIIKHLLDSNFASRNSLAQVQS